MKRSTSGILTTHVGSLPEPDGGDRPATDHPSRSRQANARHEHEYAVWETVKLPEGKIAVPGVVTHSTDVVEHPELVSQRIQRFAGLLGKENVIAGADCGFGGRSHPQIAWAKLAALVEGAGRATRALRFR